MSNSSNSSNSSKNRMDFADWHIEFIVKRSAENLPRPKIIERFKVEFAHDLPDEHGKDFDAWLYLKIDYFQNDGRRAQKWKDLYAAHHQKWRTEIPDTLYLTEKAGRLTELEEKYWKIPDQGPDKKLTVGGREVIIAKLNTSKQVEILEQIRREMQDKNDAGQTQTNSNDSILGDIEELEIRLRSKSGNSGESES